MIDISTYTDPPTRLEEMPHIIDREIDKVLSINSYQDVTVIPGYASNLEEKYHCEIIDIAGNVIKGCNSNIDYQQDFNTINVVPQYYFEKAVYLGSFPLVWGHFITDGLTRWWFIHSNRCTELIEKGYKLIFAGKYSSANVIPESFTSLLSSCGVPTDNLVLINKTTQIHELLVPDSSLFIHNGTRYFTKEFVAPIIFITEKKLSSKAKYDKIYLSRRHLKKKSREFGEKGIEKAFKKAGFSILYPEQMSFFEQVSAYNSCSIFATTEGSIAHNSIFCRPGTKVIIIRKAFYTNDYQYVINQARELNVTYIDSHLSVFISDQISAGPFFMYISDNLRRFFKENLNLNIKGNFSRLRFYFYIRICMKRIDFFKRIQNSLPEFYYKKVSSLLNN